MSANRRSTNNKSINNNVLNKFCKVCQDKGLPESVYRSHYTRETPDPSSKVCCPTLLALECRYCGANGHTVKYCAVLKDRERTEKKAIKTEYKQQQQSRQAVIDNQVKKSKNVFSELYEEDEQVQVQEKTQVQEKQQLEEFGPSLSGAAIAKKPVFDYAAALNKKPVEKHWATTITNVSVKVTKQWAPLSKVSMDVDWAADSDSDEDW